MVVNEEARKVTLDDVAFDISGNDIGADNATARAIARGASILAAIHSRSKKPAVKERTSGFLALADRVRGVVAVDIGEIPFQQVIDGQPPVDIAGDELTLASEALSYVIAGMEYTPPMRDREQRVFEAAQAITALAEAHP